MNRELTDIQTGFRKGRGTRDQIANICWSQKRQGKSRKTSPSVSLMTLKPLTAWITRNWKILKEMEILDHLTCLLRNLICRSRSNRTRHGTTDWFKIGKGVCWGSILSPCLFNLYADCIMWNAGLDESQAGIKIARRNINNLRYADDITLMAESKKGTKEPLDLGEERGWKP